MKLLAAKDAGKVGTISCQTELDEREEEGHPAKGKHDPLVVVEVLHGCDEAVWLLMVGGYDYGDEDTAKVVDEDSDLGNTFRKAELQRSLMVGLG